MKPIEALALAMVLAPAVVAVAVAVEGVLELRTPLEDYGLGDVAYRGMGFEAVAALRNTLSPAPPPWCPRWAPRDGVATCSCSLVPWGGQGVALQLPEGAATTVTLTGRVPEDAGLGPQPAGAVCSCSWAEHCKTVTTTTVRALCCKRVEEGRCVERGVCTYTYTATKALTRTSTKTATYTATLTVIPRRVNETLLGLDINASLLQVLVDYPWPGESSALVNLTAVLYNLGLGLGNETLPREDGMLLLHNLTVLVDGVPVIACRGYCAPAQPLPVAGEPQPSVSGSAELILEPPREPGNSYTFNVTICYTEDRPEPVTTCVEDRLLVFLPFKWRLTVLMDDACRVYNRLWEIVPLGESSLETVVADAAKPRLREEHGCVVAAAGACEEVALRVYEDGSLAALRTGRGEAKWCPTEPGTYTAVAVDEYENTATATFTITWSAGPPPALKRALLRLALALIAVMLGLYVVMGGGWPLRGPWD